MDAQTLFELGEDTISKWAAVTLALTLYTACASASDLDILLFDSVDVGSAPFATAGAKIAAGSLDRDGLVGLGSLGLGMHSQRFSCSYGANRTITQSTAILAAELGYQWFVPEGVLTVFAGPEAAFDRFSGGRSPSRTPASPGLRLHGEAWLRPGEDTLIQASVIAGTSRESVWARAAWGYRIFAAYLGPEASLYAEGTGYRKAALGLHVTELRLMRLTLRLGMGAQWEQRTGTATPYFALAAWTPW